MPVTILPVPRADLRQGLRQWLPRLFELREMLRALLKDRKDYYWRQARAFAGLREDFPLPYAIEIETINKCNSTCAFCPVNRFDDPRSLTRMPEQLFHKIIDDLAAHHFSGLLSLFSNNEPFLDKRIFDFAVYARRALPTATINLFTNGLALDIAKTERILSSIDALRINNYGQSPQLHPNVARIVEYLDAERPDLTDKVSVRLRLLDEFKSSRAGNAPNRRRFVGTYRSRCAYPFFQMVVRPDGKLSLCCNDALGEEMLGDLSGQSVSEAWSSQPRREVQDLMMQGRDKLDICRHCDNRYVAKASRVARRAFA
jgi:radical SAM protein with 4Fe4S-binding SPASM domain